MMRYYCREKSSLGNPVLLGSEFPREASSHWSLKMSEVVFVNEEEGKKRVMNNGKLYAKLLTKFKTDTNLNDFVDFVEAQNWEKAQVVIHTVKGIAANLSLTELFNQSIDVEAQIKGKSLKQESVENLKACFDETLIHVEEVIAKNA